MAVHISQSYASTINKIIHKTANSSSYIWRAGMLRVELLDHEIVSYKHNLHTIYSLILSSTNHTTATSHETSALHYLNISNYAKINLWSESKLKVQQIK